MAKLELKVKAKINLSLGINGVSNGYHDLDMLLASVEDIFDIVKVYDSDEIVVTMDGVDAGVSNTAYKALSIIKDEFKVTMSADITKGIPFSAGLGGSSADAAAVFVAFAKLYDKNISELVPLADKVGSDVAFMMRGGAAISKGQGSDLTFVTIPRLDVIVIKAKGGSDTGATFRRYDELGEKVTVDNELLVAKINGGKEYSDYMKNALFLPASGLNSEIKAIFDRCIKVTPYVVMSGSGSSIVVVIKNNVEKDAIMQIAKDGEYAKLTHTTLFGIENV